MANRIFCRIILAVFIFGIFSFVSINSAFALVESSFIFKSTKENYERIVQESTEKINSNPENEHYLAYLYDHRGLRYTALEKYADAVSDFTTAIKIDATDEEEYLLHRGEAYSYWGKYDEALADYTKAIQIAGRSGKGQAIEEAAPFIKDLSIPYSYVYRGDFYFHWKKYSEAINDYTTAIQMGLETESIYNSRGLCYKALGDNAQADADFQKATELK